MEPVVFQRRRASGWPISMHVVPLGDGTALVHSPTWIGDDTFERVAEVGDVRILFAPNHYHHLDLARFRARWPNAIATASAGALPRLARKGHRGLVPLGEVDLPAGIRWLVPEGTKSGEAWVAVEGSGVTTWIVGDAFFNVCAPVRGFEGAILRLARIAPGLSIGSTFTRLGIADRARYRAWTLDALRREPPTRVSFSHGDPLENDAASRLAFAVEKRFR